MSRLSDIQSKIRSKERDIERYRIKIIDLQRKISVYQSDINYLMTDLRREEQIQKLEWRR